MESIKNKEILIKDDHQLTEDKTTENHPLREEESIPRPDPEPLTVRREIESPNITFDSTNINQPINRNLAEALENVAHNLGINLNISSTTGGGHAKNSHHYSGNAIDINAINGRSIVRLVNDDNYTDIDNLMESFRQLDGINQIFGPRHSVFRLDGTGQWQDAERYDSSHRNHIHIGNRSRR